MISAQTLQVIVDLAQPQHLHAAFDPAQEGATLVAGEIMPDLIAQDLADFLSDRFDVIACPIAALPSFSRLSRGRRALGNVSQSSAGPGDYPAP